MLPPRSGAITGQKLVEFVENRLAAFCFHTASNTGIPTGSITVVQNSFS